MRIVFLISMTKARDRVTLRELKKSDRKWVAKYANNKKIWQNLRDIMPHPYTLEDADMFLQMVALENPISTFAIEWNGKPAGVCGLNLKTDIYRNSCEIGYWIAEPYWSKGIATKAVKQLVEYAFGTLNMQRVHTGVFEYNKASMRVLEKCGFEKEAVFKNALTKDGKLYNEVRYARIR